MYLILEFESKRFWKDLSNHLVTKGKKWMKSIPQYPMDQNFNAITYSNDTVNPRIYPAYDEELAMVPATPASKSEIISHLLSTDSKALIPVAEVEAVHWLKVDLSNQKTNEDTDATDYAIRASEPEDPVGSKENLIKPMIILGISAM